MTVGLVSTNLAGEGNQSNPASAATFAEPTAPQNLQAKAGIGNVSLTWEPAALDGGMNVTGYNVYRSNASGVETIYASLGVVLDYLDENATPGTRYYYRVSSLNTAGEGALSNEASARPSSLLVAAGDSPATRGDSAGKREHHNLRCRLRCGLRGSWPIARLH